MNTILLDLDGTLLPMDVVLFEKLYFQELAKMFADIISPEELLALIWGSTKEMIKNTEPRTNEEIFMEDLGRRVKDKLPLYQQRFDSFYKTGFHNVRASVQAKPVMRESVKMLKEKGYNIVIATNPLFPQEAIHTRIRWAGFEPQYFDYISTFEKNNYCKPQLKFYEEVLSQINKESGECLMVGNDVQEDLIARRLGIKTYLITDHILNRTDEAVDSDYMGTYQDFSDFTASLPEVT